MTRAAESNAIFGRSIHLYIINMMDIVSKFTADSASIIVSLSDCVLKFFVECNWIWLKRLSALPIRIVFTERIFIKARTRAYFAFTILPNKFFSAINTQCWFYCSLGNILTFVRTEVTRLRRLSIKCVTTNNTNKFFLSACPTWMIFFYFKLSGKPKTKTLSRTKSFANITWMCRKFFVTKFAVLNNHIFHLNKERPVSLWYCYLGNTGLTGRMKSIFTKPLIA